MAQLNEPITRSRFLRMTRPILGLRVSRPWLGYGDVLFIELGKTHVEIVTFPGGKVVRSRTGQATVLFHCAWRADSGSESVFGIDSPRRLLRAGVSGLRGRRVNDLNVGRGGRLILDLGRRLRLSSAERRGFPDWDIFLNDEELFPREPRWSGDDHTLGVGTFRTGKLKQFVCYDPATLPSNPS